MYAEIREFDSLTDAELLRRHVDGDDRALDQLLSRHVGALHHFCLQRMRNPADAEDLCQESLMRAVGQIDTLRTGAAFRSWLMRIAFNLSIDWRRQGGRVQTFPLPDEDLAALPADTETPLEQVQADEERAIAASALADLRENYREALVLHQIEGRRVVEVAEELKLTRGATEVLLFRARRRLREAYSRREQGLLGVVVLSGLRRLAVHLAPPLAGGTAGSVVGVIGAMTIGAAVIGVSRTESTHSVAVPRSVPQIVQTAAHTHVLSTQRPHFDHLAASASLRSPSRFSVLGSAGGSSHARPWRAIRTSRGHLKLSLTVPGQSGKHGITGGTLPTIRAQGGAHTAVPVSAQGSRRAISPVRAGPVMAAAAPSVGIQVGHRHVSGPGTRGDGRVDHSGTPNGAPGRSRGHTDRSSSDTVAVGPSHPTGRDKPRVTKRQNPTSPPVTGAKPGAQGEHGRSGHAERAKPTGPPGQLKTSPPASAEAASPAHYRGQSHASGPAAGQTPLPAAAPTPAAAAAQGAPDSAPPEQSKKSGSQAHAQQPMATAAPAPSATAGAATVPASQLSTCPPTAHGQGCTHRP